MTTTDSEAQAPVQAPVADRPEGPDGQLVRITAPLRRVDNITVSEQGGQALNPHYFWMTWEYSLNLGCGHTQVRARCAFSGDPAPAKLKPPLPTRVRCADCPPAPSRGKPRQPRPDPVF